MQSFYASTSKTTWLALIAGLLMAVVLVLPNGAAYAQCAPAATGAADDITCIGAPGGINGLGGNDTITNNGTVANIIGNTGADSLINNGSAMGIFGDDGNDTIINNGTVDNDLIGNADNDSITNNGSVGGGIFGDTGDDIVTIRFGSQVGGNIDGGPHTTGDTITFSEVSEAVQAAIATQCPNPTACNINVNGFTYNVLNFENLAFLLAAIAEQLGIQGDVVITTQEICTGSVKVFRLPNGDLEVYSGFDLLPPNGFLVAKIPLAAQIVGGVFSDPNAPIAGWTATLEMIDSIQRIVVRDAAGNIINNQCQW